MSEWNYEEPMVLNHDYGLMIDVIVERVKCLADENDELKRQVRELEIKLGYYDEDDCYDEWKDLEVT